MDAPHRCQRTVAVLVLAVTALATLAGVVAASALPAGAADRCTDGGFRAQHDEEPCPTSTTTTEPESTTTTKPESTTTSTWRHHPTTTTTAPPPTTAAPPPPATGGSTVGAGAGSTSSDDTDASTLDTVSADSSPTTAPETPLTWVPPRALATTTTVDSVEQPALDEALSLRDDQPGGTSTTTIAVIAALALGSIAAFPLVRRAVRR